MGLPVYMRAASTAVSLASVPLLLKKHFCRQPGVSAATFSASRTMLSLT